MMVSLFLCVLYVAMGVAVSFAAIVAGVVVYAVYVRADLKKSACPEFPPLTQTKDALKRGLKMKALPRQADAVVVDAGQSGLTAAMLLARQVESLNYPNKNGTNNIYKVRFSTDMQWFLHIVAFLLLLTKAAPNTGPS